jgi:hypothetical protein
LGLDWKKVYVDMLEDLGIKNVRVSAYWNRVEPEKNKYNFDELDFQVQEAEKHGAKVVLAIGRRLPRWPECHEPDWVKDKPAELQQNELLSYMEAVVQRYQDSPALAYWQVENEPFLGSFGECPKPDAGLLDREIALVKKLDPVRTILISDSGELSLWIHSGKRGDIFGTTLYRYVFSDVFNRYWVNYIPFWFYRVKGGFLRLLNPNKNIVIIGEGELVGRPVAHLLSNRSLQVTTLHRNSVGKEESIKNADIIITATGAPKSLTGDMIKDGCVVIDAGTSDSNGGIVGDVDFDSVKEHASIISPVPGGVGPVTVAMLLENVYLAALKK